MMIVQRNHVVVLAILWCWFTQLLFVVCQANEAEDDEEEPFLVTQLHTGEWFPLVGYGVGNLQHEVIADQVVKAWNHGYRLIDTAHASRNAHLIRQGMEDVSRQEQERLEEKQQFRLRGGGGADWDEDDENSSKNEIHVVTKIWYTHLGYGRTKLALQEIYKDYEHFPIPVRLHVLIHWPRCRNDIEWMHCEEEEKQLPQSVKDAGPPPHQDHQAYFGTWKALEEAYRDTSNPVTSIGVSNFDLRELESLQESADILPHILQDNVWNLVFNPEIVEYCRQHQIVYQVYNVMNGIVGQQEKAPHAWKAVGGSSAHLLYWLTMEEGVAVIPRTIRHLADNAPAAIQAAGTERETSASVSSRTMEALQALLRGQDLPQPVAIFVNKHHVATHVYWRDGDTQEEFPVQTDLAPGESFTTNTFSGHTFVVYDATREKRQEYQITANHGEEETFHIEL